MLFMALAVIGSGEDSTDWTSCADPWRCYIKNAGKSGQGPPVRPLLVLFCTTKFQCAVPAASSPRMAVG
jgi:hypothetical protein